MKLGTDRRCTHKLAVTSVSVEIARKWNINAMWCRIWLLWTIALLVDRRITDADLRGSIVNSAGNFESCLFRCLTCKDCTWYHYTAAGVLCSLMGQSVTALLFHW
jgi:hypothetical protein